MKNHVQIFIFYFFYIVKLVYWGNYIQIQVLILYLGFSFLILSTKISNLWNCFNLKHLFISVILDNNVVKKKKFDKINISDKYLTLIFSHKSHFTFSLLSEPFFFFPNWAFSLCIFLFSDRQINLWISPRWNVYFYCWFLTFYIFINS